MAGLQQFFGYKALRDASVRPGQLKLTSGGGLESDGAGTPGLRIDVGNSNGASLELSATGLELAATVDGARTFSGNVTIAGTLTVTGSTTTLDVQNLAVVDNLIMANKVDADTTDTVAVPTFAGYAVGRGQTAAAAASGTVTVGGTADPGNQQITVTVDGTAYNYTPSHMEANMSIATQLAALIDAGSAWSASASGNVITITYGTAGTGGNSIMLQSAEAGGVTLTTSGSSLSGGADLTARQMAGLIYKETDGWRFGLLNPSGDAVASSQALTASAFNGPLTGAVTGDVTGNLTGDVTGDVTGNLTGDVTGSVTLGTNDTVSASGQGAAGTGAGFKTSFRATTNTNWTTSTMTTVGLALDELAGRVKTSEGDISDHLSDSSDAHDASAISFVTADTNLSSTDVQAAIAELDDDLAAHIEDTSGAHASTAIGYTPTTGSHWADPDPSTVGAAVDTLASRVNTLEGSSTSASRMYKSSYTIVSGDLSTADLTESGNDYTLITLPGSQSAKGQHDQFIVFIDGKMENRDTGSFATPTDDGVYFELTSANAVADDGGTVTKIAVKNADLVAGNVISIWHSPNAA